MAQSTGCSPNQSVAGNTNVPRAIVTLPQETSYLQHNVQYFQDGLTETVRRSNCGLSCEIIKCSFAVTS